MDDAPPPVTPDTPPEAENIEPELVQPVPQVPPSQEFQSANPLQVRQTATRQSVNPNYFQTPATQPEAGVDQGEPEKEPQFSLSTTLGDLIKEHFFVADDIGEPEVTCHSGVVMLYFPVDDSIVYIRTEVRPGRWQGVAAMTMGEAGVKRANSVFSEQKKQFEEHLAEMQQAAKEAGQTAQPASTQVPPEPKPCDPASQEQGEPLPQHAY